MYELTDGEIAVLALAHEGLSDIEIGHRLYLWPDVVKGYVRSSCEKLGESTRRDLRLRLATDVRLRRLVLDRDLPLGA